MTHRGVYFLANDRVADLAVAFLNSFRSCNPSLPLCLIPYDSNIGQIQALQDTYHFSIYDKSEILQACDEISLLFFKKPAGEFRKLAAWNGQFDQFIYIDVDGVILKPLDFVFPLLNNLDVLNSHSNIAEIRQWTWRDSIYSSGMLTGDQIEYATNTGFFASKRDLFDLDYIKQSASRACDISVHMELLCKEQPFLNYLFVTSGRPYSSLRVLSESGMDVTLPYEAWAGDSSWVINSDGRSSYAGQPKDVFFVHWAGVWAPTESDCVVGPASSSAGGEFLGDKVRTDLPKKALWQYYRNMRVGTTPTD